MKKVDTATTIEGMRDTALANEVLKAVRDTTLTKAVFMV